MFGFRQQLRPLDKLISVEDYRRRAKRKVPRMIWAYVDGGADDEITLHENQAAFGRLRLRAKVLAGHRRRDLSTTVAGVPLDLPILLAPTGLTGLSYWRGDVAAARAAESRGTRYVVSTASSWTIEEIVDNTFEAPFFQLYPQEGDFAARLMDRAWRSGCRVLMLTVDVPVLGNREGERRLGMERPPVLTPWHLVDLARHPTWTYDAARHGRISARHMVASGGVRAAVVSVEIQERTLMQSALSWDDLRWVRDRWRGKLLVKGVLDPDDARRAVDLGVDGIVVSNHGGRQLDSVPATVDALAGVVAAVGDRTEVLLDGGVRRGTDVIKALALGARAVLIGRPYVYGLIVDGERGAGAVLDVLRQEMERTMTLMGVGDIADLDPSSLVGPGSAEVPGDELIGDPELLSAEARSPRGT
jgi:L-lactate dehydrogenase (cytochrome)/(S)-mandelate dehydrogenase